MTASISREHTPDGREAWRVRGYPEVTELLLDPRLTIQPPGTDAVRSWFPDSPMSRIMLRLADQAVPDGVTPGEERDRRRDSIRRMLDRDTVRKLSPDVQKYADELVDGLLAAGPPVDLSQGYSVPLCARVACALLGAPAEDADRYRQWAADKESSDYRRAALSLRDMSRYVKSVIQRAKTDPGDDVASHLVSVGGEEAELDALTAEILNWILSLGWQVPAAALDTGLRLFLAHPEQRARLLDRPDLLVSATEEVLRLFKLVPDEMGGVDRFALEDMEYDGQRVCQGDLVVLDVSAANRDPDIFADPGHFDISRNPNHHLTFGRGAYYCHFSRVARQELSVGLETAFRRLPGLRLDPSAADGGPLLVSWDG